MALLTFHNMYVVKLIITTLKEHIFPLEYLNSVLQINATGARDKGLKFRLVSSLNQNRFDLKCTTYNTFSSTAHFYFRQNQLSH